MGDSKGLMRPRMIYVYDPSDPKRRGGESATLSDGTPVYLVYGVKGLKYAKPNSGNSLDEQIFSQKISETPTHPLDVLSDQI